MSHQLTDSNNSSMLHLSNAPLNKALRRITLPYYGTRQQGNVGLAMHSFIRVLHKFKYKLVVSSALTLFALKLHRLESNLGKTQRLKTTLL